MAIDRQLVKQTPVDTGLARSNWLAGVNRARTDTGPILGPAAAIALVRSQIATVKTGDYVVLSNNLPYINRLNAGWSSQAPAQYVDVIVLNVATRAGQNVDVTKEIPDR